MAIEDIATADQDIAFTTASGIRRRRSGLSSSRTGTAIGIGVAHGITVTAAGVDRLQQPTSREGAAARLAARISAVHIRSLMPAEISHQFTG
jgi:hypothetical protein